MRQRAKSHPTSPRQKWSQHCSASLPIKGFDSHRQKQRDVRGRPRQVWAARDHPLLSILTGENPMENGRRGIRQFWCQDDPKFQNQLYTELKLPTRNQTSKVRRGDDSTIPWNERETDEAERLVQIDEWKFTTMTLLGFQSANSIWWYFYSSSDGHFPHNDFRYGSLAIWNLKSVLSEFSLRAIFLASI